MFAHRPLLRLNLRPTPFFVARQAWSCPAVARSLSTDASRRSKIEDLLPSYPLELTGELRRGTFEPIPSWWPWAERVFLGPARRNVAKMTAWGWMESRFSSLSVGDQKYFPDTFLQGASLAVSSLIPRLSRWDGSPDSDDGLSGMLDPVLYDHFAEAHAELARQGLAIEFEIHEEGDDPAASEIADIWLTFGPESKVLSTLMKGRVLERFNPLGFVRDVSREVGGDWHLFREVTFEYVIPQSASSDPRAPGSPSFSLRGKTIEKGQIVGLDVNVPMSLTARCRDVETDDVLWEEEVRRTVSVRFDSPHFTDSTEGGWVIADVDRLRQAERIVEEERCLGRLPGDDE